MKTNLIAYLSNSEMSEDWIAGYGQAILDLKYKLDQI